MSFNTSATVLKFHVIRCPLSVWSKRRSKRRSVSQPRHTTPRVCSHEPNKFSPVACFAVRLKVMQNSWVFFLSMKSKLVSERNVKQRWVKVLSPYVALWSDHVVHKSTATKVIAGVNLSKTPIQDGDMESYVHICWGNDLIWYDIEIFL